MILMLSWGPTAAADSIGTGLVMAFVIWKQPTVFFRLSDLNHSRVRVFKQNYSPWIQHVYGFPMCRAIQVRGVPQLYNLLKGIIEAMQGMLWLLVLTTAVPWLPWLPWLAPSCSFCTWMRTPQWLSSCRIASLGKFFPAWSQCRQFADRWFTSLHLWWWCCGARPAVVSMLWHALAMLRGNLGASVWISKICSTLLGVRASYYSYSITSTHPRNPTLIRKGVYAWYELNVIERDWLLTAIDHI